MMTIRVKLAVEIMYCWKAASNPSIEIPISVDADAYPIGHVVVTAI